MEDIYYINFENKDTKDTTPPPTPRRPKNLGKAKQCRGSKCLVLMAVCSGLGCVLLLVFIILQHTSVTAERQSLSKNYEDTVKVLNQTINSLRDTNSDLMTQKNQLQDRVILLSDELKNAYEEGYKWGSGWFFMSNVSKTWSESRQFCRDRGADLVIINSEAKQRFITSVITGKESVWIGLNDIQQEGKMKWVDNSQLKQGFWDDGEPNEYNGNEDCVELMYSYPVLNNWNDLSCYSTRKAMCEK